MEQRVYNFKKQLSLGEKAEKHLDEFYSQWYIIKPVPMELQKYGMDRTWVTKDSGDHKWCWGVEYKTDWTAGESGNAFIELWSVENKKRGWVYTSHAQRLVYYVPGTETAYQLWMNTLKFQTYQWLKSEQYSVKSVKNGTVIDGEIQDGYNSVGLIIPLSELGKHTYKQDLIKWDKTSKD